MGIFSPLLFLEANQELLGTSNGGIAVSPVRLVSLLIRQMSCLPLVVQPHFSINI